MNCANCAVATDATLAGSPASALPGAVTQAAQLAKELGGAWARTSGPTGIAVTMEAAGPGARGIVFGTRGSGIGHFFNVVNQGGVVRFLDGQAGGAANLGSGYNGFWLLRTN
jgi:filamentous hemagglutinin